MFILQLAWKNLWRNRVRTLITIAAIFFAVLLSVLTSSLKTGIFDNLIKNLVGLYSGYVQVHQKGYWDDQILDNAMEARPATIKMLTSSENVTAAAPRLETFALASTGETTKGCMVIGVQPDEENKITQLSAKVIKGQYIQNSSKGILIAEGLLKKLKLSLNDTLVLLAQGYHGSTAAGKYPIVGVVSFGLTNINDRVVYMPLPLAQEMYGAENRATAYALSLEQENTAVQTAKNLQTRLGNDYEVMTWEEMMPDIKQHITADSRSMLIVQGILYLLISFGIFGTQLMMMAERKYELGMLLAIGMAKHKLSLLLLFESVMTVLMGCVAGIVFSIPIVYYFNRNPITIAGDFARAYEQFGFEPIFPTSLNPENFIYQGIIVLAIGLILSLYPVVQVLKINPVNAMKK